LGKAAARRRRPQTIVRVSQPSDEQARIEFANADAALRFRRRYHLYEPRTSLGVAVAWGAH